MSLFSTGKNKRNKNWNTAEGGKSYHFKTNFSDELELSKVQAETKIMINKIEI